MLSVVNEVLWASYPQIYLACVGVIVLLAVLFTPRGLVNIGMKGGWLPARPALVPAARPTREPVVMTEPILVVEDVSKRFAGRIALDVVSIDVARGSMTGVIGPNGSGKSTLFNIIAGTLRPDDGRVIVGGRDITRASPAEICRLRRRRARSRSAGCSRK